MKVIFTIVGSCIPPRRTCISISWFMHLLNVIELPLRSRSWVHKTWKVQMQTSSQSATTNNNKKCISVWGARGILLEWTGCRQTDILVCATGKRKMLLCCSEGSHHLSLLVEHILLLSLPVFWRGSFFSALTSQHIRCTTSPRQQLMRKTGGCLTSPGPFRYTWCKTTNI